MGFTSTTPDPCACTFGISDAFSILTLRGRPATTWKKRNGTQGAQTRADNAVHDDRHGRRSLLLGMQITRDRDAGTLTISQEHYTKSLSARFGMAVCNPVHPTGAGTALHLDQPDHTLLDPTGTEIYQSITGSLMFLSRCTRYDITSAVNRLARAMSKPSKFRMTAAKQLLRYLKENVSSLVGTRQAASNSQASAMRVGETTLAMESQLPATCS